MPVKWKSAALALMVASGLQAAEPQVIDRVAIVVNRQMLTLSEVESTMEALREQNRLQSLPQELRQQVIQQLVEELLILDYAQSNEIRIEDQEVEDRLASLEERNPQLLQSYSRMELQERIAKDLKRQRVLAREVDPKIRVEDELIRELCLQERDRLREVEVGQILFRKDQTQSEAQAEQVRRRLAEGDTFEQLARIYSEDPNAAQNGGRMGFFKRGQILPELDRVLFSLKPGELSPAVQTQFGFHLLMVLSERFPEGGDCTILTDAQRSRLNDQAYQLQRERLSREFLAKLRGRAQVSVRL
ncbi:MAG: foldase protein PrsA [bacterium]|jgi:peptidyl-prolyl cis-trans isomerase SurA